MKEFPRLQKKLINTEEVEEIAGYLSVFTVPVLILFAEGKEMVREARIVHMEDFRKKISKIYNGYYG